MPALTGKCSELEPPLPRADRSARPLGLPRSLAGASQSRAPVLLSGPQMARTHLATARSSQLAARSGTQHAATRARPQSTVVQQQAGKKHPCPEELSEARAHPPVGRLLGSGLTIAIIPHHQGRASRRRTSRQGARVDVPFESLTFQSDLWHPSG